MIQLPASISAAARDIGMSKQDASLVVRVLGIPTTPSSVNGNARLIDEDGYRRLKVAAARLGIARAVEARG